MKNEGEKLTYNANLKNEFNIVGTIIEALALIGILWIAGNLLLGWN